MPLIEFTLLFLAGVGVSVVAGSLSGLAGLAYAGLSLVTFAAYAAAPPKLPESTTDLERTAHALRVRELAAQAEPPFPTIRESPTRLS